MSDNPIDLFEPHPGLEFLDLRGGMERTDKGLFLRLPGSKRTVAQVLGRRGPPGTWTVKDTNDAAFFIRRQQDGSWIEA